MRIANAYGKSVHGKDILLNSAVRSNSVVSPFMAARLEKILSRRRARRSSNHLKIPWGSGG